MFNYLIWEIKNFWIKKYLITKDFWFEVNYEWIKTNWEFFIYVFFDQNIWTFKYYVFDDIQKKINFEIVNKISWIWVNTAYKICVNDIEKIKQAIDEGNVNFFKAIKGVWEKTAKRIIVELKNNFKIKDLNKIDSDDKLIKKVVQTLKNSWYDPKILKNTILNCPIEINEKNIQDIIKWTIDNM